MSFDIRHDAAEKHFTTVIDGRHCVLEYTLADGVMTIVYTGVPPEVGGRGIAAELVENAFTTARANGWKVVPACSYAAAWLQRHPEFDELRA